MTKREFNMLVASICVIGLLLIAAAVLLSLCVGPQVAGVALMVAAVVLWRIGRKVGRGARQNEKRAPIGPTAEEVARAEQAREIAESGKRVFDRSLNEFERWKKARR